MPTIQHSAISSASQTHEAKQILSADTSDAGKVITPSSSTPSVGELRFLEDEDIHNKKEFVTVYLPRIDDTSNYYIPTVFSGTVENILVCVNNAFSGSDTTLTCRIDGTNITDGSITILQDETEPGDVFSTQPTAANVTSEGGYLQVTSNQAASSELNVYITFEIVR